MSLIERAKIELDAINFGEEDTAAMVDILERFFKQWDSGGVVSVAAPVLMRLIKGQPLKPLTGADDEWYDPIGDGKVLQNIRCSSVFKYDDGRVLDIDAPTPDQITFPYDPVTRLPAVPVAESSRASHYS